MAIAFAGVWPPDPRCYPRAGKAWDFHCSLQEQNALRRQFHVAHFLDGDAFEEVRQVRQSLVVEEEMKIHVLMHGLEFAGHGFVQQMNAVLGNHTFTSEYSVTPGRGQPASYSRSSTMVAPAPPSDWSG